MQEHSSMISNNHILLNLNYVYLQDMEYRWDTEKHKGARLQRIIDFQLQLLINRYINKMNRIILITAKYQIFCITKSDI